MDDSENTQIENGTKPEENGCPTQKTRIKRPKQVYDLVEVWWDDAAGLAAGWEEKLDNIIPHMVLSVGFLLVETDEYIIIAQDIDSFGSHNGRSQIPKGMVKNMKVLRKGRS